MSSSDSLGPEQGKFVGEGLGGSVEPLPGDQGAQGRSAEPCSEGEDHQNDQHLHKGEARRRMVCGVRHDTHRIGAGAPSVRADPRTGIRSAKGRENMAGLA